MLMPMITVEVVFCLQRVFRSQQCQPAGWWIATCNGEKAENKCHATEKSVRRPSPRDLWTQGFKQEPRATCTCTCTGTCL